MATTIEKAASALFLDFPVWKQRVSKVFKAPGAYGHEGIDFPLSEKGSRTIDTLIAKSYARPMEMETVLPWQEAPNMALPPKVLTQLWVQGTPYADRLTPAQRLEVAWLEVARDVSMVIHFEQLVPALYVGYINRYRKSLPASVYEYLMIFSKEEIMHTLMFQRFLKLTHLPTYAAPASHFKLLQYMQEVHPCVGILYALMIEWTAELASMHGTQDPSVDPFTREMFKQHHLDEVRHIAFGQKVVESYFEATPEREVAKIRGMFRRIIPRFLAEFHYNPEIAEHTSFDFPVKREDVAAIKAVRHSQAYQALDDVRFKDMNKWLGNLGLI
jgi:P-aminobenzoate N-oxygenase AurF